MSNQSVYFHPSRPKEIKKTDPSAPQGLLQGQQNAILGRPLRRARNHHVAQASERANRVLGVVVVPRHVVVVQKREEPVPVLFDPLLPRAADLGRALQGGYVIEKPFGRLLVFPEMSFSQAVCVDGRHNFAQQRAKPQGRDARARNCR
jgi:hypothetical protein